MKEIPILFSTPMVQAILEGRKTMTRRIVKDKDPWSVITCRYGQPGDILWVRETFAIYLDAFLFKAGYRGVFKGIKWKPSIHMPKDYARIWLQVEEIRVERLHSISKEDAISEGIERINDKLFKCYGTSSLVVTNVPKDSFMTLWSEINGVESTHANPWVWVIKFKVLSITGRPELETAQP